MSVGQRMVVAAVGRVEDMAEAEVGKVERKD